MNNQQQPIDLSKAYAGQTVVFRNKQSAIINTLYLSDFKEYYTIHSVCGDYHTLHRKDGTDLDNEIQWDIIEIKDPIQVQIARLEGEIKGLEKSIDICSDLELVMSSQVYDALYSKLISQIGKLKSQLKALTDENT